LLMPASRKIYHLPLWATSSNLFIATTYFKKQKTMIKPTMFFARTILAVLLIAFGSLLYAQNAARVTGKVLGESSEPLAGVIVQIKGNKNSGAVTDKNGQFTISVPNMNVLLEFSYVGYQTLEQKAATGMLISMKISNTTMEQVVVVGYGTQKKETLSGSVATIRSEGILTTKSTSVVSNIQGKIPGLHIRQQTAEPGTFNSLVSIRGFGAPLVVIDGIPRDGMSDFERLNPEDIESISVLKDAAAAIYGMNSDNGVLIVTTKKGSKGKAKITYSGYYVSNRLLACLRM